MMEFYIVMELVLAQTAPPDVIVTKASGSVNPRNVTVMSVNPIQMDTSVPLMALLMTT